MCLYMETGYYRPCTCACVHTEQQPTKISPTFPIKKTRTLV